MQKKTIKKAAKKTTPVPVKKAAKKAAPAKKAIIKRAAPAKTASIAGGGSEAPRGLTRSGGLRAVPPPVDKTTLDTVYSVDASGNNVTLEVNAGAAGQTSDMTIKLDDTVLANAIAGDFPETALGSNSSLNGKKLSIVANIADTSRETNLTTLTIHLKGGREPADFPLAKTVEEENESVDYMCLIEFFNPAI